MMNENVTAREGQSVHEKIASLHFISFAMAL
jgi:hypothetical protein